MKKTLIIMLIFASLALCGCKNGQETTVKPVQKTEDKELIADNSAYRGVISNYYNSYKYCDAAYQMATFAPGYKKSVMAQYGYADEAEMESQLQSIIEQSCAAYKEAYGEGYEIIFDIKGEVLLSEEELKALRTELEGTYGAEFPVEEAMTVTVSTVITSGEQAAPSESEFTVGKIENDGWYILK